MPYVYLYGHIYCKQTLFESYEIEERTETPQMCILKKCLKWIYYADHKNKTTLRNIAPYFLHSKQD